MSMDITQGLVGQIPSSGVLNLLSKSWESYWLKCRNFPKTHYSVPCVEDIIIETLSSRRSWVTHVNRKIWWTGVFDISAIYYLNRIFMRAKMMNNLKIPGEIIARLMSEAAMIFTDRCWGLRSRRRLWNMETLSLTSVYRMKTAI